METGNLRYEYERITHSLTCDVTDEDYRKLEAKLENLKNLADIENRAVSVYDLYRKKFLLKVDSHIALLGYTQADKINVDNVEHYHAMVHSDDLAFLYDSEIKMYNFLKRLPGDEKKEYKLVYDYRVRAKDGRYIRFLHQMMLYELDRRGNSWILLILSDVLSSYPEDEAPRRFLINTKTRKLCLFNEESGIKTYLLTEREKEIINLISQGLDSDAIAKRLCISVHTVNNHRQHILEKTATRNVTQAITYLKCIGVL